MHCVPSWSLLNSNLDISNQKNSFHWRKKHNRKNSKSFKDGFLCWSFHRVITGESDIFCLCQKYNKNWRQCVVNNAYNLGRYSSWFWRVKREFQQSIWNCWLFVNPFHRVISGESGSFCLCHNKNWHQCVLNCCFDYFGKNMNSVRVFWNWLLFVLILLAK